MRLSEAIALGRVTIPRLQMASLDGCALGMAANAVGIERCYVAIRHAWPWLNGPLSCPACDRFAEFKNGSLCVGHVFDSHVLNGREWSIDRLIDWVRSIEPAEEQETAPIQQEQAVEVRCDPDHD